ncbi:LUD domain-containing protein [Spongiivirga citrea]|uniref:Lactate utilization protein B/C n=1 Tax=Spongiivirga citrea TaxID=1481457 RepID=A0A6M0CKB9_9FLAO|nr:LUD domain-containing protein [Spongiivirga citrea]NER18398.1 lactate utilization protein B/C [Spongiivirga citrea]
MNIFKKLFGSKSTSSKGNIKEERGKYMPEVNIPADEKFTINFKKNGGKFIYCDSKSEIADAFQSILQENKWDKDPVFCNDQLLQNNFKSFNLNFTEKTQGSSFFFSKCEYLIADEGGILLCSKQIGEHRLPNLPTNVVIYANTSQLVDTIGEGLRLIKNKDKQKLPSNITTIKHFETKKEKDFLSYGSSSKNLYLLLLEDL